MSFAMQNPHKLFIFSCVLNPDKLEGEFQMRNHRISHTNE